MGLALSYQPWLRNEEIHGPAWPHGKSYLAITPEPFPLETCSLPLALFERPSFPLEESNRMVPIG